jgi:hypothetical protein
MAGCRLLSYYMTFGDYDFLIIAEGADAKAALSELAVAGAGGGVTDTKTVLAMTTAEAKEAFVLAKNSAAQFARLGSPNGPMLDDGQIQQQTAAVNREKLVNR